MKLSQPLCVALLSALSFASVAARAQQPPSPAPASAGQPHPHELSGFLLRQNRVAIEAALGKPFAEEKRDDNVVAYGYHLPGFKENYLIAFFYEGDSAEVRDKAIRLQLTGPEPSGPTAFFGLALSDRAEKVEKLLGKPASIRHEDDANVDLWDYDSGTTPSNSRPTTSSAASRSLTNPEKTNRKQSAARKPVASRRPSSTATSKPSSPWPPANSSAP